MFSALKWNHFVNEIIKNYFHVTYSVTWSYLVSRLEIFIHTCKNKKCITYVENEAGDEVDIV